ncbi:MarR family winged helix-turn-helix transcriptional regulator [Streptomyces sp. NPDC056910]|uniref:MarR family winged helix-turn-helix transcriptional regulator n=1 Tax=Streptomyces sp. NPDC056910 TaxID=3345964 RepID=UPI0036A67D14
MVHNLDAAMRQLRHGRFGVYGPFVRERVLDGLFGEEITPTAYRVLRFVEASTPPAPTLSDIAALLLTDRARAVRVVDRLSADGLVTRVHDTVDRRVRRVALTDTARGHLALATARRSRLLGEAVSDWPDEDVELLASLLIRLNDSVARHLPSAAPREKPWN